MNLEYQPDLEIRKEGFVIRRAHIVDKAEILRFVDQHFSGSEAWLGETEAGLLQSPPACFIASKGNQIVGFCCYNTTGKGFFGPVGVAPEFRGHNLGRELLLIGLDALKNDGYAYAIIGWVSGSEFYARHAGALEIPNSDPENSIYQNMLRLRK